MKFIISTFFIFITLLFSCNTQFQKSSINDELIENDDLVTIIHPKELKIFTKFETPHDYKRLQNINNFGKWLNNIALKNNNVPVYTYEGHIKTNPNVYVGVLDLQQPKKNLQFNSNALLRLRAEYLFRTKNYEKLDALANIKSNPITFTKFVNGDYSYDQFFKYITYYLENSSPQTINDFLTPISLKDIQIGDVFFQKGNIKSHGVIVVDIAQDGIGNKLFILAQSYYPSQDIQIITNPSNDFLSPWYQAKEGILLTPEWRFFSSDLMRFK